MSTGIDEVDGGPATDCNGHGLHVSGTLAGTCYGVAKGVRVVALRVLDCAGSGSTSRVLAGLDWLLHHHVRPAVLNLSLGGAPSAALDAEVRALFRDGVVVVAAAGNGDADGQAVDACTTSPPAPASRSPSAPPTGPTLGPSGPTPAAAWTCSRPGCP